MVLGLRCEFGMIWECFGSRKCKGKTQISGFAKERRSPVLERRGARLHQEEGKPLGAAALEGSAAALGHFDRQKFGFLGLLPGDSGDGSNVLF